MKVIQTFFFTIKLLYCKMKGCHLKLTTTLTYEPFDFTWTVQNKRPFLPPYLLFLPLFSYTLLAWVYSLTINNNVPLDTAKITQTLQFRVLNFIQITTELFFIHYIFLLLIHLIIYVQSGNCGSKLYGFFQTFLMQSLVI